MKRPKSLEVEPMTPGLCNKCSVMQLGQLDMLSMYCKGSTAKVVLKCLNHTPGPVVVAQCESTGCTGVMGLITPSSLSISPHIVSLSTQQFQIIMQFLK